MVRPSPVRDTHLGRNGGPIRQEFIDINHKDGLAEQCHTPKTARNFNAVEFMFNVGHHTLDWPREY